MASIDDFINHRFTDAKIVLRQFDRDFVDQIESTHRLETIGLTGPWPSVVQHKPKQRLSSGWHRLLEACHELTVQASILQVSAASLTAGANEGIPRVEIGRRANYHFNSWFIHTSALAERADKAIRCTTEVYVEDSGACTQIVTRYRKRVHEVTEPYKELRNEFVHAGKSWSNALTEGQFWEGNVSVGMTPQRFLDEFYYPGEADRLKSGKYELFAAETKVVFDCLGGILMELESELPVLHG